MPGRLSAQEAAELGLHDEQPQAGGGRISAEEAAGLGLHDEQPTAKDPLADRPWTAGALHAVDSLSVAGVPTVLGMADALHGRNSDPNAGTDNEPKGILDRYYKNKEWLGQGMERLRKGNPKASFVGSVAPAFIPGGAALKGAGALKTARNVGATGALYGAARGPSHTLEGDLAGTGKDMLIGAGTNVALAGAGHAAGIPIRAVVRKAKEGIGKFRDEAEKRVRSQLGGDAQVQGVGHGGMDKENSRIAKVKDLIEKARRGEVDEREVEFAKRGVNAAQRHKREAMDELGRNSERSGKELFAEHSKDLRGELNKRIAGGAKDAVVAGAAYAANPFLGVAVAGQKYGALKDAGKAAMMHPALMSKLMKVDVVARALSRMGVAAGQVPKNAEAVIYALRKHPEVQKVIAEDGEPPEGSMRLPDESQGSMYKRVYPDGR